MYWLDILIIGIGVVSVTYGLKKGVIKEVFAIFQILLPFLIALRMSGFGQKLIEPIVYNPTISAGASFVVIFLLAGVGIWILGSLLSKVIRFAGFGLLDRILGGVFGIVKAGLITGVACIFILTFVPQGEKYLQSSIFAPKALGITHTATALLPADLKEKFSEKFRQVKAIWEKQKPHIEPLRGV